MARGLRQDVARCLKRLDIIGRLFFIRFFTWVLYDIINFGIMWAAALYREESL